MLRVKVAGIMTQGLGSGRLGQRVAPVTPVLPPLTGTFAPGLQAF